MNTNLQIIDVEEMHGSALRNFSEVIYEARKKQHFTQDCIAEKLNWDVQRYKSIEEGKRKDIKLLEILEISIALNLNYEVILNLFKPLFGDEIILNNNIKISFIS